MSTIYDQMSSYVEANETRGEYCKPGQDAEHREGVLYQGPWEIYADGFSEHVRRNARALATTQIPVHLRAFGHLRPSRSPRDEQLRRELAPLVHASIAVYSAQIQQVVPVAGLLPRLVVGPKYCSASQVEAINSRRAIYTVWERMSGVSAPDVEALNRCGQAWVACQANADLLEEAGVAADKLRVVPMPFFSDDPLLSLASRKRRAGPVRFYHIGKWEPRKAQDRMLLAFLRAFRPGETILLLKTTPTSPKYESYPSTADQALLAALEDRTVVAQGWTIDNVKRHVLVISRMVSEEQILELHRMSDVYLSLSRGEGFDVPAFESKLSGNAMVYTPSGGAQGFADEQDLRVPATGRVDADRFYCWPDGSTYLDYDLDMAVAQLQQARRLVEAGRQPAPWVKAASFGAEAVGQQMKNNVAELGGGAFWEQEK